MTLARRIGRVPEWSLSAMLDKRPASGDTRAGGGLVPLPESGSDSMKALTFFLQIGPAIPLLDPTLRKRFDVWTEPYG